MCNRLLAMLRVALPGCRVTSHEEGPFVRVQVDGYIEGKAVQVGLAVPRVRLEYAEYIERLAHDLLNRWEFERRAVLWQNV